MPIPLERKILLRAFNYLAAVGGLCLLYVLLDFAIDIRPSSIQSSYRFRLPQLVVGQVEILSRDKLSILVIKRSADSVIRLKQASNRLQDPKSENSDQPEFAANVLRSSHPGYFVSYAIGTDLGCLLTVAEQELREVCGTARYDFAGRALKGEKKFRNLAIPDYNFTNDFSTLTIKP